MRKNVALAKLGKPVYYPSVTFRSQTPGSVAHLAFHFLRSVRPLNPTHPSTKTPKHRFPLFHCPNFSISAYPFQALEKPQHFVQGLTTLSACQDQAHEARRTLKEEDAHPKPFPMSTQFLIKKNPSKKSTVRRALATSIKTAICLIIVRGAGVQKNASGEMQIVLNEEREYLQNPPVVPGWTYTFTIPVAVHPPPTTELVGHLRNGFTSIQKEIIGLEAQWASKGKLFKPASVKANVDRRGKAVVDKSSELLFNDSRPVKMAPFSLSATVAEMLAGDRPSGQSKVPRSDAPPTSRTKLNVVPSQSTTSTKRRHPEAPKVKPTEHVRHPSKAVEAPEPRARLLELRQHAPSSIPSIRSKLFQHRNISRQDERRFEDEF